MQASNKILKRFPHQLAKEDLKNRVGERIDYMRDYYADVATISETEWNGDTLSLTVTKGPSSADCKFQVSPSLLGVLVSIPVLGIPFKTKIAKRIEKEVNFILHG